MIRADPFMRVCPPTSGDEERTNIRYFHVGWDVHDFGSVAGHAGDSDFPRFAT